MRLLLGIILGALLTVGAAFVADSFALGQSGVERRQIVNWDVAGDRFRALVAYAQEEWNSLRADRRGN
jgi:hypothetical protein